MAKLYFNDLGFLWSVDGSEFDPALNPSGPTYSGDTLLVDSSEPPQPDTIRADLIGDSGADRNFTGLVIDPTDSQMYGVTGGASVNPRRLFIIDKNTGATTLVGPLAWDGHGSFNSVPDIAFDSTGQLWGSLVSLGGGPVHLVRINKATAHMTEVGTVFPVQQASGNGIEFGPGDSPLYLSSGANDDMEAVCGPIPVGYGSLFSLNTGTGAPTCLTLTHIASGGPGGTDPGMNGFGALAYPPDHSQLWGGFQGFPPFVGWHLSVVFPSNGDLRVIASVGSFFHAFDGFCWDGNPPRVPYPPELTFGDTYFRAE